MPHVSLVQRLLYRGGESEYRGYVDAFGAQLKATRTGVSAALAGYAQLAHLPLPGDVVGLIGNHAIGDRVRPDMVLLSLAALELMPLTPTEASKDLEPIRAHTAAAMAALERADWQTLLRQLKALGEIDLNQVADRTFGPMDAKARQHLRGMHAEILALQNSAHPKFAEYFRRQGESAFRGFAEFLRKLLAGDPLPLPAAGKPVPNGSSTR
jgi:hypothetical protein